MAFVTRLFFAFAAPAMCAAGAPARPLAAELVMLERPGCVWCRKWNEEIAPIYPKTPESKQAPLRRVDITRPWPADLAAIRADVYTPTFVLVADGREIDRLRGYPGDEFFWALLNEMLAKLPEGGATAQTR